MPRSYNAITCTTNVRGVASCNEQTCPNSINRSVCLSCAISVEDVTECVGLLVLLLFFNGMADDDDDEGEVLGDGEEEVGMCCNDLHCLMEVRIGDAVVLSLPPSSLSLLFSCNDILLSKLFIASDMIKSDVLRFVALFARNIDIFSCTFCKSNYCYRLSKLLISCAYKYTIAIYHLCHLSPASSFIGY